MKKTLISTLSIFGLCIATIAGEPKISDVYKGLRDQVLSLKLKDLGLNTKEYSNKVYGTLMETGYKNVIVTVVSIADGTTSIYFSNGGGMIGNGQEKIAQRATTSLIHLSENYLTQMKSTKHFPYPKAGEVKFYVLTSNGVFTYSALENDLGNKKDKLSKLFYAGQGVISAIRAIDEKRKK